MKEDTKFVYSLSSKGDMVKDFVLSASTLSNYVDMSEVVVFYTPPYSDGDEELISNLGVDLRKVENITESFSLTGFDEPSGYGEKVRLTEVDSENVVFLDCDTLVLNDVWEVIKGEFEFKARPGSSNPESKSWQFMFERENKPVMDWMPNAGFLVFKNSLHKKIESEWKQNLEGQDFDIDGTKHLEQYALALSVAETNLAKMTELEHTFGWVEKPSEETVVYHKGSNKKTTLPGYFLASLNSRVPVDLKPVSRKLQKII